MATLLGDEIERELGVTVVRGLLDKPRMLDNDSPLIIDHLIPDYRILERISYSYGLNDAYLAYATRGCPNRCGFCAVNRIEPKFTHYLPLKKQVRGIEMVYGPKKDLLLLDNNVAASREFKTIIADIMDLGFERGGHFGGRLRRVDFNQGLDARRLTPSKIGLLARTALAPFRMAFDDMAIKESYLACVKAARDHGLLTQSPYVLFNYTDTPTDFYNRLRINVMLNEELETRISSFPMKFIPLNAKDRTYVGKHWSKKLIRGVQCILLVTRGMVTPRREFFEAAFGSSAEEFLAIALMPEDYIIYRRRHESQGAADWKRLYNGLTKSQRRQFLEIVADDKVTAADVERQSSLRLKHLLSHYVDSHARSR